MNEVLKIMGAHRTVRAFQSQELDEEILQRAVSSAQMAATSSWIQAYSLLRIKDTATRQRLSVLCGDQAQVLQASAFFVVLADTRRHRLIAAEEGVEYVSNLETFLLSVTDATLFAQNLALAFEAMGLGTCFIGGLRNRLPEVDQLLHLPHGVMPLFGLCVGEPAQAGTQKPRLPLSAVLFEERYPSDEQVRASVREADQESQAYYVARGEGGRTWSGGTWRKFTAPMRAHLAGYYRSKGASFD